MNIEDRILHEDNHLLVLNKPAGVATMGTDSETDSLVDFSKAFLKKKYSKPGNVYLGVVSRLDAFVSGCIVLAKTSKAASRLSEQIRNHQYKKLYLAVVEGVLANRSGTLKSWLRKNERLHRVESFPREVDGSKQGILNYRVLAASSQCSLVEVELITGRKHQIRSQFSDIGHSIFGDQKYDARTRLGKSIALHCHKIEFQHPTTRELLTFSTFPPKSWNNISALDSLVRQAGMTNED